MYIYFNVSYVRFERTEQLFNSTISENKITSL